jgi:phage/plasmid primase, P4 family, C-terminal domain
VDDPFASLEPLAVAPSGPEGVRAQFDQMEDIPPPRPRQPPPAQEDPVEIEVTEDGVARAFTEKYGGTLRFDHDAGRWYHWQEDHWQADTTSRAFEYCRRLARLASEGAKHSLLSTARKASFAGGVERLARADPAHAVTQEAWDRDPWLVACPGETVDLRTGRSAVPRPEDGITRRVAVAPAAQETCPTWWQFLEDATGADSSVMRFLQQWAGYSLTGITREHTLVFLYGDGGNGKSVFINTLTGLLGDYAATAGMETFTASKSDRHPTDLAMLAGARLVAASETEEGRAWAESRIKQMTGGDRITARFMRRDFFTYTPQFKLTLVGNHRPALANVKPVEPWALVVPAELETVAQQVLAEIAAAAVSDVNPFSGTLELIVEPGLTSATGWYLIGNPALHDGLAHAFLDGQSAPRIETRAGWNTLGMEFRLTWAVDAKFIGTASWFRNPGASGCPRCRPRNAQRQGVALLCLARRSEVLDR